MEKGRKQILRKYQTSPYPRNHKWSWFLYNVTFFVFLFVIDNRETFILDLKGFVRELGTVFLATTERLYTV